MNKGKTSERIPPAILPDERKQVEREIVSEEPKLEE